MSREEIRFKIDPAARARMGTRAAIAAAMGEVIEEAEHLGWLPKDRVSIESVAPSSSLSVAVQEQMRASVESVIRRLAEMEERVAALAIDLTDPNRWHRLCWVEHHPRAAFDAHVWPRAIACLLFDPAISAGPDVRDE